jgi:hypothetical protein
LLHVERGRIAPPWASIPKNVEGAPRLYVSAHCRELIKQLKSAPVAAEGLEAGEAVDKRWESDHGHGVASARYGAMSRPGPSEEPERPPDDPAWDDEQRAKVAHMWRLEQQFKKRMNEPQQNWEFV